MADLSLSPLRVEFDKKDKYVCGRVVHHTGKVLIDVSEDDESLKEFLIG